MGKMEKKVEIKTVCSIVLLFKMIYVKTIVKLNIYDLFLFFINMLIHVLF